MGVERAVTRWFLLRNNIIAELEQIEERLAQLPAPSEEDGSADAPPQRIELEQAREKAHARLRELGPSPQPKMG